MSLRDELEKQLKWDKLWLEDAVHIARKSKDPSTKVGVVIVSPDGVKLSEGYNGFPRGISDTPERLNDRDTKLKLVVHAELNAILNAARVGIPLRGATMYVASTDKSGIVWGGPPCTRCTVECIQAGIFAFISYPLKTAPSRWHADCEYAGNLIKEAKLTYREVPLNDS